MKKTKFFSLALIILTLCLTSCSFHSKDQIPISSISGNFDTSNSYSYKDFDNSSSNYSYSIPDRNSHYTYPSSSSSTSSVSSTNSTSSISSSSSSTSSNITDNSIYALIDLPKRKDTDRLIEEGKTDDFYIDLATQFAKSEIEKQGYLVFRAFALLQNDDENDEHVKKYAVGLAFTMGEFYDSTENIYSCGFIQILFDGNNYQEEDLVTDEKVSKGIMVVGMDDQKEKYIIESSIILNGFSGIYYNKFFSYKQKDNFTMTISIKENKKNNYDEDLDLYDFDLEKYIYKASIFQSLKDINAFTLYGSKAAKAYQKSIEAINALIELQDQNGIEITLNNILVFSQDLFETMNVEEQREKINGVLKSQLDDIQLEKNQYITITKEKGLTIETDYTSELAEARVANGLINTLVSLSMLTSGFVIVVGGFAVTGGVAGFIFCTAEMNTMAYAFSKLVEGVQDIYYGGIKDTTSTSYNPVKSAFQKVFGNEKGEKIYHLWGVMSTLTTSFVSPISTAINKAQYFGYGIIKTALQVTRTAIVHLSKIVITDKCAEFISSLSEKITENIVDNKIVTSLVGYASGMITGMFVYGKLNMIDIKFDISGLRMNPISISNLSKEEIAAERRKMGEERSISNNQAKKVGKVSEDIGDGQKSLLLEKGYSSKSQTQKEYCRDVTVAELNNSQGTNTVLKIVEEYSLINSRKYRENLVYYVSDKKLNGYYDPNIDVIYLNKEIADNDGVLTLYTIAHLMRHAYQMKKAEIGSPILNSLRKEVYDVDDTTNLAEIDASGFASYYLERARYALNEKEKNQNINYIYYPFGEYPLPSTYYEGGR